MTKTASWHSSSRERLSRRSAMGPSVPSAPENPGGNLQGRFIESPTMASLTAPATLLAIYIAPKGATAAELMKPI